MIVINIAPGLILDVSPYINNGKASLVTKIRSALSPVFS